MSSKLKAKSCVDPGQIGEKSGVDIATSAPSYWKDTDRQHNSTTVYEVAPVVGLWSIWR